jgi:glycosyltransferase involved in cell wall biosynthesis
MTKNEEAFIRRCLLSIRDVVDELIVFDTGSCDRTIEISQAIADGVEVLEFDGDFAAARNRALARVEADWILALDADEHLDSDIDRRDLRNLISGIPSDIGGFNLARYSFFGNGGFFTGRKVRLFRNSPTIRYSRAIHEDVSPSIVAAGGGIFYTECILNHQGHLRDPKVVHQKYRTYIARALAAMSEHPRDAMLPAYVALMSRLLGRSEDAMSFSAEALAMDPDNAFVLATRGYVLMAVGRIDEARPFFVEASVIEDVVRWTNMVAVIDMMCLRNEVADSLFEQVRGTPSPWIHVRLNEGINHLMAGRPSEASSCFKAVRDRDPVFGEFWIQAAFGFDPWKSTVYETVWDYPGLQTLESQAATMLERVAGRGDATA